jgi:glycosyltransferase involved in cell wall biosynthesis
MTPVFSIITPTCNRPIMLRRNILSVKNQTFESYEHIIVDDANDPGTEKIIEDLDNSNIILLKHEKSKGAAGSYNTGIKASKGKFILFLDDDDEYMPCTLKKLNDRFVQTGSDLGFIWTGIARIKDSESGEKLLSSFVWPSQFSDKEEGLIAATSIGNGFGVCVRKECLDKVGLYDESLTVGEDTDLLIRLAQQYKFGTVPEVLVKIHQHDNKQLTSDNNFQIRVKGKELVINRYHSFFEQYPRLFYTHYRSYAEFCYKYGLRKQGRKALLSVIKRSPVRLLNYTDLISFELTGKDSLNNYIGRNLRDFKRFLKKEMPKEVN